MKSLRTLTRKIERSIKTRGMIGSWRRICAVVIERLRSPRSGGDRVPAWDVQIDAEFDRQFGVDTGGMIPMSGLDVQTKNWIHASAYVPTAPMDLDAEFRDREIEYADSVFVDLGCGKGRVVLMAAGLPFKQIVGIEFSEALSGIARDNLRRYRGPRVCDNIAIETMDAVDYRFPADPLVLFLYHPFDGTIMSQVVRNLVHSHAAHPRRILLLYFKSVHADVWNEARFLKLIRTNDLYSLYDSRP